jgi:hypothetical protein
LVMVVDKRRRVAGYLGTAGGASFSELGFSGAFNAIGHNTGNALFQYALWQRIRNPKVCINIGHDLAAATPELDVLVIPAANQINPAWDLTPWADLVERLDLPVAIAGLGAQADIGGSPKLDLKPGTVRFLKSVSERTRIMGLRGPFTQAVLEHLGIHNTKVTGCPSHLINPSITGANIALLLERAKKAEKPRLGHVFGTMEEATRHTERILFRIGNEYKANLIFQTNPHVLNFLYDGTLTSAARKYFAWEAAVIAPEIKPDEYLRIVQWRGTFYSDARTWIDSMRRLTIVLGMRIHGVIAAIQGGTLGICVPFDSRTLELVQTMGYPFVRASEIEEQDTLHTILSKVTFDAEAFDRTRSQLRKELDSVLTSNGLDIQ